MNQPLRLGVLISGGGRTLLNLLDEIEARRLDARIAVVIASRPDISGVPRARERGLDVRVIDARSTPTAGAADDAITECLLAAEVDLVCACGYLRLLRVDAPLAGRIMNIHPALLPDFGGKGMYGDRVHRAVLAAHRAYSGCTVHFVDDRYDHGPIVLQRMCPVLPDDDVAALAARVFREECAAYPEAIRLFGAGRLELVAERVRIRE